MSIGGLTAGNFEVPSMDSDLSRPQSLRLPSPVSSTQSEKNV